EVLVIVAAMSIQDPRERPVDKRSQADQQHARFRQEGSDFAGWWHLWTYLKDQQKALSGSAFRRMCKREYLHYLRIREWQDLHSQLTRAAKQQKLDTRQRTAARDVDPDWDTIHQALLTGLLSHIGLRDEDKRDYLGAAAPASPSSRARRTSGGNPPSSWRGSSWRPRGCGPARRPGSTRFGPSAPVPTWSSAPPPSRGGARRPPPSSRPSG